MKLSDVIRNAFAYFRVNKMRTVLTVAGVGIGIGAILFLVSLGFGLQRLTKSRILNLEALSVMVVTVGRSAILKLDNAAMEKFAAIPGVEAVAPTMSLPAQIVYGQTTDSNTVISGVQSAKFDIEGFRLSHGTKLNDDRSEALLTAASLKNLNVSNPADIVGKELKAHIFLQETGGTQATPLPVTLSGTTSAVVATASASPGSSTASAGKTATRPRVGVVRHEKTFRVVGVISSENVAGIYVHIDVLQDLGVANYNLVKLKMSDRKLVQEGRKEIEGMGYSVTTIADTLDQIDAAFRIIQIVLGGFGVIAMFVASIGMFNTLTISLLERTHEIGIMKALGATNRDIRTMFLGEAVLMSTIGGLVGIVIGSVLGYGINGLIFLLAKAAGGEAVSVFYTPPLFLAMIAVFSVLTGLVTGFYPAQRAVKLSPMEALRYE